MSKKRKIIILALIIIFIVIISVGAYIYSKQNSFEVGEISNNSSFNENVEEEKEIDSNEEIPEETVDIVNTEEVIETANVENIAENTDEKVNTNAVSNSKPVENTESKPIIANTNKTNVSDNESKTVLASNTNNQVVKTGTTSEQKVSTSYGRYNVKITTTETIYYDVYSDGSKKETGRDSKNSYDASTFKATTGQLKAEAQSLVSSNSSKINSVLSYMNQYRKEKGLNSLKLDNTLCVAATVRSLEMAWTNRCSHTRPNGTTCFSVLSDMGYGYGSGAAENIASGYTSAASVSAGWKNSSGHYANIIDSSFTKIGIGVANANGGPYYWAELFN